MFPIGRFSTRPSLFQSLARSFAKEAETVTGPSEPVKALYLKQLHEPKYLELLKPRIPYYDLVNVRLRGFDFPILESYVKFIQKTCQDLKLDTSSFWALPATCMRLDSYQPSSELVTNSDVLKIHERTVQIKHMTSRTAALFVEAMMCAKPPGVVIRIGSHQVQDDDVRYIPDLQLEAMEKELDVLKNEPVSVLSQVKKKRGN